MAIIIILAAIVLLVIGYVFYGSWLAKQWGVDPNRKTPAHELEDGVDYVAAKPAVLMGHHFSSIAGAGPINGPIQAAVFGWVPVFLWCVIGGIFFGGLQDFGSLFASIRHGGKSVGEIIRDTMGKKAQKLFIIFALLVLVLVIASFVNVVAGTFASTNAPGFTTNPTGTETTAIGAYITIASLVPVWILLQPRDYLSSFLLYAMMGVAVIGIIFSAIAGTATFEIPAFAGWTVGGNFLFPTLFITVACGACSGFHSLISTGTSSKQLDNERDAKPIGYGSMLIESGLAIIALIAVGVVFSKYTAGDFGSPSAAFAAGIATMFGTDGTPIYNTIYALLTLAVSVFALTSLDTGTRLSRFMFSELFLKEGEQSWKDATGFRKVLTFPITGTLIMVVIGCVLGFLSLSQIWALFGAANQLLAGIALLAVAAWLGNVGKNNKMFLFPMAFMLIATLTSLVITVIKKFGVIGSGEAAWGDWFQLIFAAAMGVLAIILAIEGIQTLFSQKKVA